VHARTDRLASEFTRFDSPGSVAAFSNTRLLASHHAARRSASFRRRVKVCKAGLYRYRRGPLPAPRGSICKAWIGCQKNRTPLILPPCNKRPMHHLQNKALTPTSSTASAGSPGKRWAPMRFIRHTAGLSSLINQVLEQAWRQSPCARC
jgi:hypothetical protein